MPILSPFSLKLMFISTTILSAAFAVKLTAPTLTEFAIHELPSIYNNLVSWLKPPYLYLVINCIIISIMASSKLQSKKDADVSVSLFVSTPQPPMSTVVQQQVVVEEEEQYVLAVENDFKYNDDCVLSETKEVKIVSGGFVDETSNKENEILIEKTMKEYSPKPPIVGRRFGNRKTGRASPEGGKTVLGVTKPKRQDTLESTWKTITEGRAMPLNRHLKKSDGRSSSGSSQRQMEKTPPKMKKSETFNDRTNTRSPIEDQQRQIEKTPPKMKKYETFNDRTDTRTPSPGSSCGGSAKVRKEPSLSQDELNRRVEAFIKKFNEDMRLQRQESMNQYKKVVNRGAR